MTSVIIPSLEAQRQVLGKILIDSSLYYIYANRIKPHLFQDSIIKQCISAYCEQIKGGDQPDAISLSQKSKNQAKVFEILSSICQGVKYEISIESSLNFLENEYRNAKISIIASSLTAMVSDGKEALETLSWLKKQASEVDLEEGSMVVTAKKVATDLATKIREVVKSNVRPGMSTGITKYDSLTGGLQPTDLVLIAGRTGQGKTSLALKIAQNLALKENQPGLIVSLEMGDDQLIGRLASADTGINSNSINSIRLDSEQVEQIVESLNKIGKAPIYFYSGGAKLEPISNSIRKHAILYGIRWVIIDYIQLVKNNGFGKNPETEIAEIAREFKNLAKELSVNVMALSQLRRAGQGSDPEPNLAELRGSGQLEEAADQVIFSYRPEEYGLFEFNDKSSSYNKAELIIAKGRNTGVFRVRMDFIRHLAKFMNEGENDAPVVREIIDYSQPTIPPNEDFIDENLCENQF